MDDDELEEELEKEEEDKEVARIYRENKKRHEQMLRGTCINCVVYNVEGVESAVYEL